MNRNLQLTTVGDHNLLGGLAGLVSVGFNLADDVHTFDDTAENDVAVIEPGGFHGGDEELGSVGVRASIGH